MLSRQELCHLDAPELGPVREFVTGAFKAVAKGGTAAAAASFQYGHILAQLRQRDDPEMLWRVYIILADFVVQIAHSPDVHKDLLQSLFSFDWNAGDNIIAAYVHLMGLLVSANPNFLPPVAKMIVRNLVAAGPASAQAMHGQQQAVLGQQQAQRHARLHGTLKSIMSLAPSGQTGLFTTLAEMFPYKLQTKQVQMVYVSQLLCMCQYLPHFQQRILDLIISKCLELDADVSVEDGEPAAISALQECELSPEDMFDFELEAEGQGQIGGAGMRARRISSAPGTADLADKLDGILALLVRFVETQFSNQDSSVRERTFLQLLGIFERRVLTMQRSKFVQFIVFYMCSKHAPYTEVFSRRLLDVFLLPNNSLDHRHCAVMYLASFYCHSACCPPLAIRDGVLELMLWCGAYCDLHHEEVVADIEGEAGGGVEALFTLDLNGVPSLRHETLSLAVQAVCYTLSFYGDDLWVHFLALDSAVISQFHRVLSLFRPLRFAHPVIRTAFFNLLSRTEDQTAAAAGAVFSREEIFSSVGTGGGGGSGDREYNPRSGQGPLRDRLGQSLGQRDGSRRESSGPGPGQRERDSLDALEVMSASVLEYVFPFDRCLLAETGTFVESGYQACYDTRSGDKFENVSTVVPNLRKSRADTNEDDKSSSTSILQWPTLPTDEEKLSGVNSSYESPHVQAMDAGTPDRDRDPEERLSAFNAGALSPPKGVPAWVVPPLHPLQKGPLPISGAGASALVGGEWATAKSSRRQHRRRKVEEPSGTTVGIAVSPVTPDHGKFSSPVARDGPSFRSMFTDRNHMTAGSGGVGIVPTFDNFGVPSASAAQHEGSPFDGARGDRDPRYPAPANGERAGAGGAHHPALNDFQKRAREYSVGSVGSW
jgi:hypothetical protein